MTIGPTLTVTPRNAAALNKITGSGRKVIQWGFKPNQALSVQSPDRRPCRNTPATLAAGSEVSVNGALSAATTVNPHVLIVPLLKFSVLTPPARHS